MWGCQILYKSCTMGYHIHFRKKNEIIFYIYMYWSLIRWKDIWIVESLIHSKYLFWLGKQTHWQASGIIKINIDVMHVYFLRLISSIERRFQSAKIYTEHQQINLCLYRYLRLWHISEICFISGRVSIGISTKSNIRLKCALSYPVNYFWLGWVQLAQLVKKYKSYIRKNLQFVCFYFDKYVSLIY